MPLFNDANEVFIANHQLKNNKKDVDGLLSSNVVINALVTFYDFLCMLINMTIRHGHVASEWHLGTIVPLLKAGNLNKSSLSSYWPITLSSLFGKVIDLLVLSRYQEAFCASDLQFDFTSRHSTNQCTLLQRRQLHIILITGPMFSHAQLTCKKHLKESTLLNFF